MTGLPTGIPNLTVVPPEGPREMVANALQILTMTKLYDLPYREIEQNLMAVENRLRLALLLMGAA